MRTDLRLGVGVEEDDRLGASWTSSEACVDTEAGLVRRNEVCACFAVLAMTAWPRLSSSLSESSELTEVRVLSELA